MILWDTALTIEDVIKLLSVWQVQQRHKEYAPSEGMLWLDHIAGQLS